MNYIQEEERFANSLIEEFEKGTILDCENGCTLRAYLSRKLHCAPMRISKKYAGKSIGKHVFLSRLTSHTTNATSGPAGGIVGVGVGGANTMNVIHLEVQENLRKIRELEFRFHMSLLQEGAVCTLRRNMNSYDVNHAACANTMGGNNSIIAAAGRMNVAPMNGISSSGCDGSNNSVTAATTTTTAAPLIFPLPQSNVSENDVTCFISLLVHKFQRIIYSLYFVL
jgi:hypothetical protein